MMMNERITNKPPEEESPGTLVRLAQAARYTAPVVATALAEETGMPNLFESEELTTGQRFGVAATRFAMRRAHDHIQARRAA